MENCQPPAPHPLDAGLPLTVAKRPSPPERIRLIYIIYVTVYYGVAVYTVSDISLEHRKFDIFLQVQIGTDIISLTSSTDNGTVTHEVNGPQCKSRNNKNHHF